MVERKGSGLERRQRQAPQQSVGPAARRVRPHVRPAHLACAELALDALLRGRLGGTARRLVATLVGFLAGGGSLRRSHLAAMAPRMPTPAITAPATMPAEFAFDVDCVVALEEPRRERRLSSLSLMSPLMQRPSGPEVGAEHAGLHYRRDVLNLRAPRQCKSLEWPIPAYLSPAVAFFPSAPQSALRERSRGTRRVLQVAASSGL
jgi:hypothetical protein